MAKNKKKDDVRKAREQAVEALNTAVEQIRTPLLAALGAGDLATQAVVDAVNKARTRVTERAEAVRGTVEEVPGDLSTLREKLDPAELRKLVEDYSEAATKLYQKLADQGEDALTKFRGQPQVKKAIDQVEDAIAQLQERLGDAKGDARELTDDLLGKLTRRTRSVGEKTARAAQNLAEEAAEAIEEAGDDVAHTVRSTSRKVANRTAPAKAAPRTVQRTTQKTTQKTTPKTASRGSASKTTATTK